MAFSRERRAHLARKWHILDGLEADEIAERMELEGIVDSITRRTISRYLDEAPAEETVEKIRENHAEVDLQIAERQEQLYQRAHEAEMRADKEVPIQRVVPETSYVSSEQGEHQMPDWRILDSDDERRPEWASERDTIIEFVDDSTRYLQPGDEYPKQSFDGSPKYTTEFVGLETVRNEKARAFRRQEQAEHLEKKGEILGAYEEQLHVDVGGSIDLEHSVPDEIVTAVVGASHNRLNNADGSEAATDADAEQDPADE